MMMAVIILNVDDYLLREFNDRGDINFHYISGVDMVVWGEAKSVERAMYKIFDWCVGENDSDEDQVYTWEKN